MVRSHFSAQASKFARNIAVTEFQGNVDAPVSIRYENGLKFLDFKSLVMSDWDPAPEGQETDGHYTVNDLSEVDAIMNDWTYKNPDQLWRGYKTPSGGAHAFLISHVVGVEEGQKILAQIHCDNGYISCTGSRNKFGCRISPKKRLNDFIASYWKQWGTGIPHAEQVAHMAYHDSFLRPANRFPGF